jgi:hypothetical protein
LGDNVGAWLPYDCPEDVCKAVQKLTEVQARLGTVHAWPWNRYQQRETAWWLVPQDDGAERPAYPLGKFYFEFGDESNRLDVGLYLERGASEAAVTALGRSPNEVLTDDWMWSRFVADLRAAKVTDAVRRASHASGLQVYLAFALTPLTSAASSQDLEPDVVCFTVGDDGRVVPDLDPPSSRVLRPFRSVSTVLELAGALEKVDGFTWVDVRAGVTFDCGDEVRSTDVWTADRVWKQLLAPLDRWVGRR